MAAKGTEDESRELLAVMRRRYMLILCLLPLVVAFGVYAIIDGQTDVGVAFVLLPVVLTAGMALLYRFRRRELRGG